MQYNQFIDRVQTHANLSTQEEAVQATEAFLATLGEVLYRTECRHLAAQLPKELKDLLFKQQPPEQTRMEVRRFKVEEFYRRVGARVDVRHREAIRLARAVGSVLREAVSAGQLQGSLAQLPDGYTELFGGPAEP